MIASQMVRRFKHVRRAQLRGLAFRLLITVLRRAAARAVADADKHAEKMRREMEKKKALEEDEASNAGVPKPKKKGKKGDDVSTLLMAGLNSKEAKKKTISNKKPDPAAEAARAKAKKAKEDAEQKARAKGIVMDQDHLLVENMNRQAEDEENATGIDGALSMLGVSQKVESKNLKVLYNAFEQKTIAQLREEQPGLKLSQYKDKCFALWAKSPENPKNQVA